MLKEITELNDELSKSYFEKQINGTNSRYAGGVVDEKTGIPSPTHTGTGSVVASWVSSYVNPESRFFHDEPLAERIEKALDYILNQQHEDGTISPGWTNYHSPPDTGFMVSGFVHIYQLLDRDDGAEANMLAGKVKTFLEKTIPAMLTGGCHTPNHRWVLTSALSHLYFIFGKKELLDRAEEWLAEGIDMTEDGEWTERSNGIYNTVSNIFLYHTARLMNKPELLNYVRKNLDMMQYLIHPNGEVVTDYSGRQDFGNLLDLSPYYLICRLMAYHDDNPIYAAMADLAAENLTDMGPVNNHIMMGYLLFPFIQEYDREPAILPNSYEVWLNEKFPINDNLARKDLVGHGSKIEHSSMHEAMGAVTVRYRQDAESATVMSRNASIFSLRKGYARLLGVRVTSSFSPGLILFDTVERIDNGYRLRKRMEKGYKGPVPKQHLSNIEETSIWYLLPHQHRKLTHNQEFEVEIDFIHNYNGEWTMNVKSDEREDVFMQVEFLFPNDGLLEGGQRVEINDKSSFWEEGTLTYQGGDNQIQLHAGAHEHWIENIGGTSEVKGVQSVKVNLVSPVDKLFHIKIT